MIHEYVSRETVLIGDKIIDKLTDNEGIEWYPWSYFTEKVLFKNDRTGNARDSVMRKYMAVFDYPSNRRTPNTNIKTWCMNTEGIRFYLRHTRVKRGHKGTTVARLRAREKAYYEACMYFKVRIPDINEPKIINVTPKLVGYDNWSLLCLENDISLSVASEWKKCDTCEYYYPNNARYYGIKKMKNCLQCQGKDFVNSNPVMQYLYEHNGYRLLTLLREGKVEDSKIVKELNKVIELRGVVLNNENQDS